MVDRDPTVIPRRRVEAAWVLRMSRADGTILQRRIVAPATVRIGSGDDVDLEVRGPGVAPHHASLHLGDARAVLHDRGSPLGTYVNSLRCREPQRLGPEDRVTIAGATFSVSPAGARVDTSRLREGFLADESEERGGGREAAEDAEAPPPVAPPGPSRRMIVALAAATAAIACVGAHALVSLGLGLGEDPPPSTAVIAPSTAVIGTIDPGPAATSIVAPADPGEPSPTRRLTVAAGDTWESLGRRLEVSPAQLRALNPHLRRPLRGGDVLAIPAAPAGATSDSAHRPEMARCGLDLAIPGGAAALGEVTRGALSDAIQVPDLDLFELRCRPHAFATSSTARHLIDAIACFRGATGYAGEVVVGDISREHGGPLGHHKSHQSGRDVDLWLPVVGGRYPRGCRQCGTDLCRPEPEAVDWRATWALIDALAATGAVKVIFLDLSLQPQLRDAALAAGASPRVVEERIQWPRTGAPTLVQHADGHVHHMHVRFRCGADEGECSEQLTRR